MQSGEFHSAHADRPSSVATFGAPTWATLLPPSIVTLVGRLRPSLHLNGLRRFGSASKSAIDRGHMTYGEPK